MLPTMHMTRVGWNACAVLLFLPSTRGGGDTKDLLVLVVALTAIGCGIYMFSTAVLLYLERGIGRLLTCPHGDRLTLNCQNGPFWPVLGTNQL